MRLVSRLCRLVGFGAMVSLWLLFSVSPVQAQRAAAEALSPQEAMRRLRESPHPFTISTLDQRPQRTAEPEALFAAFVSVQRSPEGDGWTIYVDEANPHWLAYGACQAIWESDPEYRASRSGAAATVGLTRESECLVTMLESYVAMREVDPTIVDELAEELRGKLLAGSLDAYLLQRQRRTKR